MKRNYRYIILSVLVGLIVVAYWMLFADFSLKKDAYIFVDADDTADSVYVKLDRVAAPGHFLSFKALSAVMGYRKHIRHGRYTIWQVNWGSRLRLIPQLSHAPFTIPPFALNMV